MNKSFKTLQAVEKHCQEKMNEFTENREKTE